MSLSKYNKTTKELEPIAGGFDVQGILDDIGDLTDLDTSTKTDLVSAVNEVKGDIPTKTSDLTNNSGFVGLGETASTAYAGDKGKANTSAIEALSDTMAVNGIYNLLPHPYEDSTKTIGTITYTVNNDWSITIEGNAQVETTEFVLFSGIVSDVFPKVGKYKIGFGKSIFPAGLAFRITINGTTTQAESYPYELDVTSEMLSQTLEMFIRLWSGFGISPAFTVYPVVYPDGTMTNRELTERFPKRPTRLVGFYGSIYQHGYGLFIPYDSRLYGPITVDMISNIEISWGDTYNQNIRIDTHQNMLVAYADNLPADPQYIGCFAAINFIS